MRLLFLTFLLSASVNAQTVFGQLGAGSAANAGVTLSAPITESFNLEAFGFVQPTGWAEALAGVGTQVGPAYLVLYGGFDTDGLIRSSITAYLHKGSARGYFALELGPGQDNYWYLATPEVGVQIRGGIHAERFVGLGPRLSTNLGPVTLHLAVVNDLEQTNDHWRPIAGFSFTPR